MEFGYLTRESSILIYALRLGLEIGVSYDVFRIIRRSCRCPFWGVAVLDLSFWTVASVRSLYYVHTYSNGLLRWFVVLGCMVTVWIYMQGISGIIVRTGTLLATGIKSICKKLLLFLTGFIKLFIMKLCRNLSERSSGHGEKSTLSDEIP